MDARITALANVVSEWLDQETLDHRNFIRLAITNEASAAGRSIICSKAEPFYLLELAQNDLWLCLDESSQAYMRVLRLTTGVSTNGLMLNWVFVDSFTEMFDSVEPPATIKIHVGEPGPIGPSGAQGADGPQGPKGDPGLNGMAGDRPQVEYDRLLKFVLRDPDVKATLPGAVLEDPRFVGLV